MPFGGPAAETALETRQKLAGQRDFRQQNQHLPVPRQRLGHGLEINLRLARAGHAVQHAHGKAARRHALHQRPRRLRLQRRKLNLRMIRPRARVPGARQLDLGQRPRLGQPVDHRKADVGHLGQLPLGQHQPARRRINHALASRRQPRGRRSRQPETPARLGIVEGVHRAHHHLEHHAQRRQRVARHPFREPARHFRQPLGVHALDHGLQLLGIDGGLAAHLAPHHADALHRAEGHQHEIARRQGQIRRHEIIVCRIEPQRQQNGHHAPARGAGIHAARVFRPVSGRIPLRRHCADIHPPLAFRKPKYL